MAQLSNILSSMPAYMRQDTAERIVDLALNRALDRARAELGSIEKTQLDALAAKENLTTKELEEFFKLTVPNFNAIVIEEAVKLREEIEQKLAKVWQ